MKVCIEMQGKNVVTFKDLENVSDRGEIAHFICELEAIRHELLNIWEDYDD